jgi:DNA-binding GntR family transcriptional regulator
MEIGGGMSLRARAYEMLEEMIITQGLEPGAKVTEMELSQRLGIGRTPVREARAKPSSSCR